MFPVRIGLNSTRLNLERVGFNPCERIGRFTEGKVNLRILMMEDTIEIDKKINTILLKNILKHIEKHIEIYFCF